MKKTYYIAIYTLLAGVVAVGLTGQLYQHSQSVSTQHQLSQLQQTKSALLAEQRNLRSQASGTALAANQALQLAVTEGYTDAQLPVFVSSTRAVASR
jgi:uncharacterized protein HemX